MAFLDKAGLKTLTNKLVQGDAIKVASHRGHTVKKVVDNIERECANVSNPLEYKLENRVAEFKVGQGRDVDASGDVETGYSEIGLQGKTWNNLVSGVSRVSGTQNCEVTNLDLNNLSFEMLYKNDVVGNTSQNRVVISSNMKKLLKPSTVYTFIYKYTLLENPYGEQCQLDIAVDMWGQGLANSSFVTIPNQSFLNVTKVSTHTEPAFSTMASSLNFINQRGRNTKWRIEGLTILEGDYTQTPVEELPNYFEGIQSSFENGVVEIENVGKNRVNLLNKSYDNFIAEINTDLGSIKGETTSNYRRYVVPVYLEEQKYTMSAKGTLGTGLEIRTNSDGTGDVIAGINITSNTSYRTFAPQTKGEYYLTFITRNVIGSVFIEGIQLELGSKSTPYEPHKKDILFRELGLPLRSLPNGVCDEIVGDKHIQRVGKVVLDGSENWSVLGYENTIRGLCEVVDMKMIPNNSYNMYCNSFKVVKNTMWGNDEEQIEQGWSKKEIGIRVLKSKLNSQDLSGFKKWLQENPVTVYYELAEPSITPIELLKTTTKPLGTYTIKSDIAPVSTHTVQLNRAGQIERAILDISELKNRVDVLENYYDSTFLEAQHKLDLLGLDYDLETGGI